MLRLTRSISLLITLVALSLPVAKADPAAMFAPERVGRWYLGGGVGGFWEKSNSQLQNQAGQYGGFFSGGYRATPNIALDIDGLFSSQRLDTPPTISTSNGRSRLDSVGAGGVVKFILPLDRVELYAGGGLGLYTTSLHVKDSSFHSDRNDTNVGYQGLLGIDFFLSRRVSIGLEYRKFKLDADLQPTIPGKIDAGGDLLFGTVRGYF